MRVAWSPLAELPSAVRERLTGDRCFASAGFADLWRAKGGRPVAWRLEVDGAVGALLPGVEFGRGPLARFQSMPDGCYGGVLCDPDLAGERPRFAAALLAAVARRRYAKAFVCDFHDTVADAPGWTRAACATTLIDIAAPGWLPPDRKLQEQVRKAEREGIVCEPFDWTRHQAGFLALMRATERRHGHAPAYPARFFEALADLARRDPRVQWVWCGHDGRPACSHIYVLEAGVLQGWQIYFDKAFSFLKPNQYIRLEMCRRMAARGVTRLNLGGTPAGAPGLAYYKRRWGGEPVTYDTLTRRCGPGRLL